MVRLGVHWSEFFRGGVLVVLLLPLTMLISNSSVADSYRAFRNFRQVDPTGRYYVVFRKNGGPQDPGYGTPVTFEIASAKSGSADVDPVDDTEAPEVDENFRTKIVPDPEVRVRDGDRLLGRGKLDRCPSQILISSTGLGFVGLDVRGYNFGDVKQKDALVIVAADGTVRHRLAMIDLFTEDEIRGGLHTAGGIWWCHGGWIDETRREVVVVGPTARSKEATSPNSFRIVNLQTGSVRKASSEVILTALSEKNRAAIDLAASLAARLGLGDAKPVLIKIYEDATFLLQTRLEVAVALGKLGDSRGGVLLRHTAYEDSAAGAYAIANLPFILGDQAAEVLCDIVRKRGEPAHSPAWQAMHHVTGVAAVLPLIRLLWEGPSPDAIDFAVESLGIAGEEAKPAIPDLIELLKKEPRTDDPQWTQELAAMALGRIGPAAKAALPDLISIAKHRAPEELERVNRKPPEKKKKHEDDWQYSDDSFVDAICRIRAH